MSTARGVSKGEIVKIIDWENFIFKTYKVRKIKNLEQIKSFYTHSDNVFKLAYDLGTSLLCIYLSSRFGFYMLSIPKNEKSQTIDYLGNFDYELLSLYYTLRQTNDINNFKKTIEEKYHLKELSWDELTEEEQIIFTSHTSLTIENMTEQEISSDKFYSAYQFDEKSIANREIKPTFYMGIDTTIVFIESEDNLNISQYCIRDSGGLTEEESDKFATTINPIRNIDKN